MVATSLENLENLEKSGIFFLVRENLENLEKSGNFFFKFQLFFLLEFFSINFFCDMIRWLFLHVMLIYTVNLFLFLSISY